MNMLKQNCIWYIIELPKDKKTVGCKWVFTIKCKVDGKLERYKETFASVAKIKSIKVLLTIAINFDWPFSQLEIKNVFLNGDLEEKAFMELPPSFEVDHRINKVCKLQKSLYSLKQLPRA